MALNVFVTFGRSVVGIELPGANPKCLVAGLGEGDDVYISLTFIELIALLVPMLFFFLAIGLEAARSESHARLPQKCHSS